MQACMTGWGVLGCWPFQAAGALPAVPIVCASDVQPVVVVVACCSSDRDHDRVRGRHAGA
jgi:hypothetical protein